MGLSRQEAKGKRPRLMLRRMIKAKEWLLTHAPLKMRRRYMYPRKRTPLCRG